MRGGIFLVGPMATGKTAIARELSRQLRVRFIDTDAEVESAHGPIPGIFAAGGEAAFRAAESEALRKAAEAGDAVVATGGGAVLDAENRVLLAERFTVYLETDIATVGPRIRHAGARPLLAGDPLARWTEIFTAREPFYRECARLTVDARAGTPAQIATTIGDVYRRRTAEHGGKP
ncbi:shikimate kinase [Arthrobacter sp. KK5.5]|uniref:shikimate kinase n=1 Tax=Arthrobacter sp. KK5.5 TaxID=3373084 RepID=UPI003EE5EECA